MFVPVCDLWCVYKDTYNIYMYVYTFLSVHVEF